MIEKGLIEYLLANPALTSKISNRLHELVLPQAPSLPAVVWQRVSGPRDMTHSGPAELANPRFQFACWAKTLLEAIETADALRSALNGYAGAMGSEEAYAVLLLDDHDLYDPETGLRRRIVDYRIWHKEV